jgi:SAM-dependent methyltransferase
VKRPPRARWSDREGRPVDAPEPPPAGSHYRSVGDFQGREYERNAFALGTAQETAFLVDALDLGAGARVVDVGCGTGRHVRALAARGIDAVGVDLSHGLLTVGAAAGCRRLLQADARALPLASGVFDAAWSLCQGGFGITPATDRVVLAELARLLRPGGRIALTAYSLAFAARWMAPEDALDVRAGLLWSAAEVRGADGQRRTFDLWTACYSAAHLEAMCASEGLRVDALSGVEPGAYTDAPPTVASPELLVLGTKDHSGVASRTRGT